MSTRFLRRPLWSSTPGLGISRRLPVPDTSRRLPAPDTSRRLRRRDTRLTTGPRLLDEVRTLGDHTLGDRDQAGQ